MFTRIFSVRPKRLARLVVLALLAGSSTAMTFGASLVHNHLVKSSPSEGDSLRAAPVEIKLWFSERPEVAFTSATLIRGNADSTRIGPLKAAATDDTLAVKVAVPATLEPGTYVVAWRTASRDGHAIRGRFRFTVAP